MRKRLAPVPGGGSGREDEHVTVHGRLAEWLHPQPGWKSSIVVRVQSSPGVVLGHDRTVRRGSAVSISAMLSVVVEAAASTAAQGVARVQHGVDVQVLDDRLCPV